jgi:hypothetical protein
MSFGSRLALALAQVILDSYLPAHDRHRARRAVADDDALARMRQGDSDRDIASARLMGRGKLKTVRQVDRGWLDPARPLPDDAELAAIFGRNPQLPRSCVSTIEPFRDLVRGWFQADVQGTTIFNALKRILNRCQ